MTFNDLLRQRTRKASHNLENCVERIRTLGNEKHQALVRKDGLEQERNSNRGEEESKRQELTSIETEIKELERELEEVRAKSTSLREDLSRAEEDVHKLGKQAKKAQAEADKLEHEIQTVVGDKKRHEATLRSDRREALWAYVGQLEVNLAQYAATQEEKDASRASLERLETARHQDREIMDLWEARTEYQEILKMSRVRKVRERQEQALSEIESQIEARFPGALAAENTGKEDWRIEEIFFSPTSLLHESEFPTKQWI